MQSLYQYINNKFTKSIIDCHVHLFGDGIIHKYPYKGITDYICMVENSMRYPERTLIKDFDKFIKSNSSCKLLCVGSTPDETLEIYNKYTDKISGFGEIKCYKRAICSDNVLREVYDTSILKNVLDKNLPVFIHWDLDRKHDEELYDIIKENPKTKFVLCHCGINRLNNAQDSFETAISYQAKLPNLWLSISWDALDYFVDDSYVINDRQLARIVNPCQVIVGTDFNPEMPKAELESRYKKFIKIYNKFDVPMNLNNLFA